MLCFIRVILHIPSHYCKGSIFFIVDYLFRFTLVQSSFIKLRQIFLNSLGYFHFLLILFKVL